MKKLRIFAHISLDGFISPPGDSAYAHGGWTAPYRSVDGRELLVATQGERFDLILGRRTYDLWSGHWPKAPQSPLADSLNAATKYIATHRPDTLGWGPAEALGADVVEGVRLIKAAAGPDLILWGSASLTSLLLDRGLVDEVVLISYPVLLGRGKRFFADTVDPRELALISTKTTSSGLLLNVYRHVGALRTE